MSVLTGYDAERSAIEPSETAVSKQGRTGWTTRHEKKPECEEAEGTPRCPLNDQA